MSWLYLNVPPGKETNVTFENGVVTMARDMPYEADRRLPAHEWTRQLMAYHLSRMEAAPTVRRDRRSAGLAAASQHRGGVSADRDVIMMLPWDLLSTAEQSGGRLSS